MDLLETLARGVLWLTAVSFAIAGVILIGGVVLGLLGVGENEN